MKHDTTPINKGILLGNDELKILRLGVIKKFEALSGVVFAESGMVLNSYLPNYRPILKSVAKKIPDFISEKKPLANAKLMANLLFFSVEMPYKKKFRLQFVENMYEYAFGMPRAEFLERRHVGSDVLKGYWDCYFNPHEPLVLSPETKAGSIVRMELLVTSGADVIIPDPFTSISHVGLVTVYGRYAQFNFSTVDPCIPTLMLCDFGKPPTVLAHNDYAAGILTQINLVGTQESCRFILVYRPDKEVTPSSAKTLKFEVLNISEMSDDSCTNICGFFASENTQNNMMCYAGQGIAINH